MKKSVIALLLMSSPVLALADNGAGCGPGAGLWRGKTGLVAHTSAGTTNGTFSSPLFGLLSGTSGCENPGVVSNEYQKQVFVAMNMDDLAQDVAQGKGAHLSSLANLMGIQANDESAFFSLTQRSYDSIFVTPDSDYKDVLAALNGVLGADGQFAHYVR